MLGSSKPSVRTPHVGHGAELSGPQGGEHLGPFLCRQLSVDHPGGHADLVEGAGQVVCVGHGHAEDEGLAVPTELLDGSRNERVPASHVDGLFELGDGEVGRAGGRQGAQIRLCGDPHATERHEVALADHGWETPVVHDLLEDAVQSLAIAPSGGRREAHEQPAPVRREAAEVAEHADVVGRGRVVALVVDHELEGVLLEQRSEALGVEASQGGDHHIGIGRSAMGALLEGDLPLRTQGGGDLLPGLVEQLAAVGEHQGLAAQDAQQRREDHRLASTRRQHHDDSLSPPIFGIEDRFDGRLLIVAELESHRREVATS